MRRLSRRSVLTAVGSGLLAGCTSVVDETGDGGTETVTPHPVPEPVRRDGACPPPCDRDGDGVAGPDPLGYELTPDGVSDVRQPDRERVLDSDGSARVIAATATPEGLTTVIRQMGGPPALLETDATGGLRSRRSLSGLPSNRIRLFTRLDRTVVVGGHVTFDDGRQTWLRGYRDGARVLSYRTQGPGSRLFTTLTTVDGGLLAAGAVVGDPDTPARADGILTRLEPTGETTWDRRYNGETDETVVRTVTITSGGILAGGRRGRYSWLATTDPGGRGGDDFRIPRGEQAYRVRDVVTGQSGVYLLAEAIHFGRGDTHLLVLALAGDGRIQWTRQFDPNRESGFKETPRELMAAGIVDRSGPLVVGRTLQNNAWLGSMTPSGGLEWAGYYKHRVNGTAVPTRPSTPGLAPLGDGTLVFGSVQDNGDTERPWLAWWS